MKVKTVAAGLEGTEHEVIESEEAQSQPQLANAPSPEEIRQRAYELHVEGGCVHGRDDEDWLQAERELKEKYRAH
jgi:Protein of unknown function (DUF2934)